MECHRYRTTNFLIPIINFHVTAEFQFNFFSSTILHSFKPSSSPLLLIDSADLDNFYRSSLNNQIRKKKGRESSQVKKQERINKNKKQLISLDRILQMENCMHADWNSWLEIGGGGPFYSIFSATLNSPRGRGGGGRQLWIEPRNGEKISFYIECPVSLYRACCERQVSIVCFIKDRRYSAHP